MIGIYKITSPTGRIYIGQSIDISRRFYSYKRCDCKTSVKLHRSLLKHGADKHIFEVVELCVVDLLNERERYYQELYNANSETNLNVLLTSTETKKQEGLKISEAQKLQISKVHKGKVLSEETKTKIRLARARQIITQEHKDSISKNNKSARLIVNLETGIFYNTIKDAAKTVGIKSNTLNCALLGKHINKTKFIYA